MRGMEMLQFDVGFAIDESMNTSQIKFPHALS